jgi:outer membrane protein TolC
VVTANSQVTELTQSLNTLMGLPLDTQLELADPPPVIEPISSGQPTQQAIDKNPEVVEAQETLVKARAASHLSKLDYMPDVAGLWGYSYQTVIPALPRDFSFVGFMATWNVFDFGKRERTMSERSTQVKMAETNLALVRAKMAASTQKASLDVQRTRRILELTRRVASIYRAMPADYQTASLEMTATRAEAEGEMFQAELDYRLACAELKQALGNSR